MQIHSIPTINSIANDCEKEANKFKEEKKDCTPVISTWHEIHIKPALGDLGLSNTELWLRIEYRQIVCNTVVFNGLLSMFTVRRGCSFSYRTINSTG